MSTSRYAVVRRLSRVLLLPLHGHTTTNDRMRRRKGKDASSAGDQIICTKENCLTCCKKFTAFMFSRVGLFFVMIGYVTLGGWLFQALEARNEQDMRRSMSEKLNSTLYKLWDEILRVNSYPFNDKRGNFTLFATQELEKFETTVIQQVQQGFDGRTRPDADPDWNFFGAVLYAVTLISTIGYGHITTKTVQGKIATVLYSAFGVPLMMLFVANIGSTMAKMFAFAFSRIKMICCCQWKNKKKRISLRNPEKDKQIQMIVNEKKSIEPSITKSKSNLKRAKDEQEPIEKISSDDNNERLLKLQNQTEINLVTQPIKTSITDKKQLPADIRLDMLTGVSTTMTKNRSVTSSTSTVDGRPKDALVRINELIRQNSVQDAENKPNDEVFSENNILLSSTNQDQQQQSDDIRPIQFYINETNKLTTNLESSIQDQNIIKSENDEINITNLDDITLQQAIIPGASPPTTMNSDTNQKIIKTEIATKKSSNHKLKRSISDSTTNRLSPSKSHNNIESSTTTTNNNEANKSPRRRFFLRKSKKSSVPVNETNQTDSIEQQTPKTLQRKSQSFDERINPFPPPPNYEESTTHEITSSPSVTWKPDNELLSTKKTFNFPINPDHEDDDEYYEDEEMSVPLLVTVCVIPLYLTLGAILFNIWEKWGFLNSFYFCFITVTTIGFGDYVPGSSLTVSAAKEKLISASLYILLGLVLIAMCFNLMKEQLSQKIKKIAGKWGILEL